MEFVMIGVFSVNFSKKGSLLLLIISKITAGEG